MESVYSQAKVLLPGESTPVPLDPGALQNVQLTNSNYIIIRLPYLQTGASPAGGQGGHCPPRFISCSPTVFFWEKKVAVFGRKNRLNL